MDNLFSENEIKALNDLVLREVPLEKARSVLNRAQIARILEKTGSFSREGIGQRTGVIDARTFYRWHQQYPGCWNDPQFRQEFLRDNPECRAKGYKASTRKTVLAAK